MLRPSTSAGAGDVVVVGPQQANLATLQGGQLATSGSGEEYTAGKAKVVCGNVDTRNATVYIIDTVLMPSQ